MKAIMLISYSMHCAGMDRRSERNQLASEDERNLLFLLCAENGELDCDKDEWPEWPVK
jgi:hypothetical protein